MKKIITAILVIGFLSGCNLEQKLGKSGCTIHEFVNVSGSNGDDSTGIYIVCPASIKKQIPSLKNKIDTVQKFQIEIQ